MRETKLVPFRKEMLRNKREEKRKEVKETFDIAHYRVEELRRWV